MLKTLQYQQLQNYRGYFSESGDRLYLYGYIYQQLNDVSLKELKKLCMNGFLCLTAYTPQRNREINLDAHDELLRQLRKYNVRHINMVDVWKNTQKPEMGSIITQYALVPHYPWSLPLESLRIFYDLTNTFDFPEYLASSRMDSSKFKMDIRNVMSGTSVAKGPRLEHFLSSPETFFLSLRVAPEDIKPRQWEFVFGGYRIPSEEPTDLHVVQNEYEIMLMDAAKGNGK